LGTHFKEAPSVVIAKIDATTNDISKKLGVRGFPTIKLFTAGNKDVPVEYNGDRSFDDLVQFINTHSSVPLAATHAKDEL